MKEVILYRHAEAEPAGEDRPDQERRLTAEGRETARQVGFLLRHHQHVPQRVLCSDAHRAVETAELSAETSDATAAVERVPQLYTGSAEEYIALFADQPQELDRVMIVGHNPIVAEVLERLTGRRRRVRAGDAAVLRFDVPDWITIAVELGATLLAVLPDEPPRVQR